MSNDRNTVITIRPKGESASAEDIVDFATDVAIDSVVGIFQGLVNTVSDVADCGTKLCKGDLEGSGQIVKNRAEEFVKGTIGAVRSGAAVTEASYDALVHGKDFLTEENKAHLTRLCQLGIYSAAATTVLADSHPEGTVCSLEGDACTLPGVENGVFIGDQSDLNTLIAAGEVEGSTHVDNAEITRSSVARTDFLAAHGIDDTQGYQVHHIQPLSEGGADTPENMVLMSSEDHSQVTAAHADYYGWKPADKA